MDKNKDIGQELRLLADGSFKLTRITWKSLTWARFLYWDISLGVMLWSSGHYVGSFFHFLIKHKVRIHFYTGSKQQSETTRKVMIPWRHSFPLHWPHPWRVSWRWKCVHDRRWALRWHHPSSLLPHTGSHDSELWPAKTNSIFHESFFIEDHRRVEHTLAIS